MRCLNSFVIVLYLGNIFQSSTEQHLLGISVIGVVAVVTASVVSVVCLVVTVVTIAAIEDNVIEP